MNDYDKGNEVPVGHKSKPEKISEGMFYGPTAKIREKAARMYRGEKRREIAKREELEKILAGYLRDQHNLESHNRAEMSEDERYYHSEDTQWDKFAQQQPAFRDLRVSLISTSVDFLTAHLAGQRIEGKVNVINKSVYNSPEDQQRVREHVAREYDMRLKSAFLQIKFDNLRAQMIENAHRAGCGYLHYGLTLHPQDGKYRIKAECPHWSNVYWDTNSGDIHSSRYAFVLKRRRVHEAIAMWPEHTEAIKNLSNDHTLSLSLSEYFNNGFYNYGNNNNFGTEMHRGDYSASGSTSDEARSVTIGSAYFRDMVSDDKGTVREILLFCKIATNSTFERVLLLSAPTPLFGHNMIPIVQLRASTNSKNGLPYAPMVRRRRGLERAATSTLRQMVRMTGSRGVVVNVDEVLTGAGSQYKDVRDYVQDLTRRVQQPVFVLTEYGEKGAVRVEHMQQDKQKLHETLQTLTSLASETSGIHPAVRGQKSSVHSGTAIESVEEQSMNVMVESMRRLQYDVVEPLSNQLLSIIEQYGHNIALGGHNDPASNRYIEFTQDGDLTITGNSAQFDITPMQRGSLYSDDERQLLQGIMAQGAPEIALALLPTFVKSMPNHSPELFNDIKHILISGGVPVAPSMLTDEERQALAQAQQQKQQQQQQMYELEMAEKQADIEGSKARAYAQRKGADEPSESEKTQELRNTIAQLSEALRTRR